MTSKKYGEHLNEMLGIHKKYTLLHDTYHGGYSIEYEEKLIRIPCSAAAGTVATGSF